MQIDGHCFCFFFRRTKADLNLGGKSADAGSENLRGVAFPCSHWAFLPCLEMLSEAVLSPSFQANFKHIGGGAKRAKEARTLYIS